MNTPVKYRTTQVVLQFEDLYSHVFVTKEELAELLFYSCYVFADDNSHYIGSSLRLEMPDETTLLDLTRKFKASYKNRHELRMKELEQQIRESREKGES